MACNRSALARDIPIFWRKLHSLTGIVPIGAFLVEHIVSNFEAINGPLAYAKQVKFLN